jgi:ABC-type bacteriocin/lantibiotic exporter with double-glycine peptidase domain
MGSGSAFVQVLVQQHDRRQRAAHASRRVRRRRVRALRTIGALDRFDSLPEGPQTDVQTRGLRLPAGERQLVGIARVALADPALIVLDEATSSLDPATEAAVGNALAAVAAGRTVITIAHRLSTAQRADRVAVFEHGRLVEVASQPVSPRAASARLRERPGSVRAAGPSAIGFDKYASSSTSCRLCT